jgi:hypothetical protein
LDKFNVDEPRIKVGKEIAYNCGKYFNKYESPYGSVDVERNMYQTSEGGKRICPLEIQANMICNSTPKFAKILAFKAAHNGAPTVQKDLYESNSRTISVRYIKEIIDKVGEIAEYSEKNGHTQFQTQSWKRMLQLFQSV